jgi:hypothetical protein
VEDKPEGLLAEDIAPNASEALLAAFGSCLALGIHANAIARRISVQRLELELEADINTPAVWGSGNIDPKPIGFEEGSRAFSVRPTRTLRAKRSPHSSSMQPCGLQSPTRFTTRCISRCHSGASNGADDRTIRQ